MTVGQNTAFAYKVLPDLFYPELISVGNNSVIGYNTTILTHEVLVDEWRYGKVHIGDHTLIGANVTILPGVKIGNHVKIGAGTVLLKMYQMTVLYMVIPCKLKFIKEVTINGTCRQ